MARVPSHLFLRGGVYAYRRRVPPDLQTRPEFAGKEIFQKSLGVRTLEAARKLVAERGYDLLFSPPSSTEDTPVEAVAPETPDIGTVLTTPLLRQIANENFRRGLETRRKAVFDRADDDEGGDFDDELARQHASSLNQPEWRATGLASLRRELEPMLIAQAEGTAARLGIEPTPANIGQMVNALFESEIALNGARVDFLAGNAFPSWSAGGTGGDKADTAPTEREAHWTFKKLAEVAMQKNPKGESWEHKVKTVAAMFDEYIGGIPVYKITRRKVRDFLDDVQFMPKSMTLRFPNLTLTEAIAANRARAKPYPTVAPNTARDGYFSILRWVFNYAVKREALPVNPCMGVTVTDAKKGQSRQKKPSFKIEELNALFRLPPFTGSQSANRPNTPGDLILDDHRKWAPLLMLFTGARTSEVAQLAVSDIRGDSPFPHILILTEYDEEDPDDDRDFVVSFKTANARREVPIHPNLVSLGFLDYVEARREAGDVRLFPEWKLPSDARKLYSSATWVRTMNDTIIPKITQRRPKPTLYSFRHTWKTRMVISHVPAQLQNRILGHADVGMDGRYMDHVEIADLYNAIKDVKYDGLDLSALKRS